MLFLIARFLTAAFFFEIGFAATAFRAVLFLTAFFLAACFFTGCLLVDFDPLDFLAAAFALIPGFFFAGCFRAAIAILLPHRLAEEAYYAVTSST